MFFEWIFCTKHKFTFRNWHGTTRIKLQNELSRKSLQNAVNYVIGELISTTYSDVKPTENGNTIQNLYRWFWWELEPLILGHWQAKQCHSLSSEPDCLHRKLSVLNVCLFFMLKKVIFAHPRPGKIFQLRKMTLRSFVLLPIIWLSASVCFLYIKIKIPILTTTGLYPL